MGYLVVKRKFDETLKSIKNNENNCRQNQAYSGILKTLCNPGIFRTLVYS